MPTTQEAIARLRMIFETEGAAAAAAEMKKLETAETSLGTSSLNLDRAFGNLERRFSETARATFEYERSMKTLNAAVAQNPALAERAAAVQQTIAARYQATMQAAQHAAQAQTAYGQVSQAMQSQMQGLAASTGLFGSMLSTLGKAGTVAAVGIGGLYLAYEKLDAGVTRTAQYARDIRHFAEATGLTTSQVQGLNKEATRFGISTEDMHTGLLKFTAGFEEARNGGGAMLDMIRKIDPALGDQALAATTEVEALNIVTEALRRAGNEFERAALARAAFGRGGLKLLPMMQGLDMDAVTERYASRGLSQPVIDELDKLQSDIDSRGTNIANKIYGSFGVPWLEAKNSVLAYIETVLKIGMAADAAKSERGRVLFSAELGVLRNYFPLLATTIEATLALGAASASASNEGQEGLENLYNAQAKLIEQIQKMQEQNENYKGSKLEQEWAAQIQKKIDELKNIEEQISTKMEQAAPAGKATTPGTKPGATEQAQLGQMQALVGILGNLASIEDIVALKTAEINVQYRKLSEEGRQKVDELREAILTLVRVQAEMSKVEPGTYNRQLEAINAIKAAYPGLVAQDAMRMQHLDDQLRIAKAMPGVAQMQAAQWARITQLLNEGKSAQLAITIAAKERAIVQAQINTQAQQQLLNLQNQAGVAAAVTGAEKIRAQELATINALLQQGVDLETATAIAAQERKNAEAAVNASIQQQIASLNESTELIYAQIRGNELNVRVRQAYNRAIREGADAETAAALAAATYNNLIAQRALQAFQAQQQYQAAPAQEEARATTETQRRGLLPGAGSVVQEIEQYAQAGSAMARTFLGELQGVRGAAVLAQPGLPEIVQKMRQEAALAPQLQQFAQTQEQARQQLKSLQDQGRLGAAGTPQEKAQIQAQITYEDLIKQGVQSDLAHQIANQQLANAMADLAKSVDENTTALQNQLDPIYTEGRAALRIGYYGEGSGGTMRTVTGTGYANDNTGRAGGGSVYGGRAYIVGERGPELFVPGASGTIVPNSAPRGADAAQPGNVIIINNNFPPGAVMGDRRTQYQAANSYGRAVAAMGS